MRDFETRGSGSNAESPHEADKPRSNCLLSLVKRMMAAGRGDERNTLVAPCLLEGRALASFKSMSSRKTHVDKERPPRGAGYRGATILDLTINDLGEGEYTASVSPRLGLNVTLLWVEGCQLRSFPLT